MKIYITQNEISNDTLNIMTKDYGQGRTMQSGGLYAPIEKKEGYIKDSQMLQYGKSVFISRKSKERNKTNRPIYKIRISIANYLNKTAKRISPIK